MILRGSALKPADDSPFVNEVFSPAFTDLVFQQVGAERERLVASTRTPTIRWWTWT
jgi:L-ornithine N5-oxygenase